MIHFSGLLLIFKSFLSKALAQAIVNWIAHFAAGRNISIKHSNSWKCSARCGALGVNWD